MQGSLSVLEPFRRPLYVSAGGGSTLLTGLDHWWDLGADVNADAGGVNFTNISSSTGTGEAPDGGDCRVLSGGSGGLEIAAGNVWASGTATTIAFWVYQTSTGNEQYFFFENGASDNYYQHLHGSSVSRAVWGGTFNQFSPGVTMKDNWRCVVVTGDGSGGEIFIDGSSVDTTTGTPAFGSAKFGVGLNALGSYDGDFKICSMAIWSRVLTSAEITEFYNSGTNLRYADL